MSRARLLAACLVVPALLGGTFGGTACAEDGNAAEAPRVEPGNEGPLAVPGTRFPCHIAVPSDYVPGVRLPLILFLHGSGGKPTSWPWTSATGGKGYLIVGLSYGSQADGGAGGLRSDAGSRAGMQKFIEQVRALVDERYGIDQRRVFLTGLSMGGWGVNFYGFAAEARGRYRGYCIMAAGIAQSPPPDLSVLEGLPLLLLNGEQDANLRAANLGVPLFRQAGALLEQVVLPGEGHVPSTAAMAKPLKAWLDEVQQADEHARALAAVRWTEAVLEGTPQRGGGTKEQALLAWIRAQPFLKDASSDKPTLLFLGTDHEGRKGGPSTQALETRRADEETFSFPAALQTPAAARAYACVRASLAAVGKGDCPLLNREHAPLVLLVDRERTSVRVLAKGKLKDASLARELRAACTPAEIAAADARVAATRPVLVEMRKLRRSIETETKALAKLRTKPADRVRARLAQHTATLEFLTKRYEELHARLVD